MQSCERSELPCKNLKTTHRRDAEDAEILKIFSNRETTIGEKDHVEERHAKILDSHLHGNDVFPASERFRGQIFIVDKALSMLCHEESEKIFWH